MADNVERLLLQLTAQDDATDELTGLEAALAALDRASASPEVQIKGIAGALVQLTGFSAALEAFSAQKVTPDIDLTQLDLFAKSADKLGRDFTKSWTGQFIPAVAGAFSQLTAHAGQLVLNVDDGDITDAEVVAEALGHQLEMLTESHKIRLELEHQTVLDDIDTVQGDLDVLGKDTTEIDIDLATHNLEQEFNWLTKRLDVIKGLIGDVGSEEIHPDIKLEEKNLEDQLTRVQARLSSLKSPELDIDLHKKELNAELDELKARLVGLEHIHPHLKFDVDTSGIAEAEAIAKTIEQMPLKKDLKFNTGEATMELAGFRAALLGLPDPEIDPKVAFPQLGLFSKFADDAARTFQGQFMKDFTGGGFTQGFQQQMKMFSDTHFKVIEDVEVQGIPSATAQLLLFEREAAAIDGKDINVDVNVDRKGGIARFVSSVGSLLSSIGSAGKGLLGLGTSGEKAGGMISGLVGKLTQAGQSLGNVASEGEQAGGIFSKIGEQLAGVTVNLGAFGARLGPVLGVIIALIAVIGTALVGALALLASALASAIVFAGGLAVALGGALLPAILVLLPAFLAFSAVMKVMMARQQEAATATERQAQAHRDAVLYARQHADAEQNLSDAMRNQADSQKQSAQAIAEAHRQEQDAVSRLRDATVSAYREMQDAIEAAKDAKIAYARAQLTNERAALNIKLAKKALVDFRKQLKLTGQDADAAFRMIDDVGFDPAKLNARLAQVKVGAGGKDPTGDQLKLQGLILDVKDAYQQKTEAVDGVSDANRNMNRTEETARKFQEKGIGASAQYKSALDAVATARRGVTRAEESGAKRESDAIRAVADARKQISRLQDDREYQKQHGNVKKSTELTRNLTGAQRNLLNAITKVWGALKTAFGPAGQALIGAFATGLQGLVPFIQSLQGPLTKLGGAFATSISGFFTALKDPKVQSAFLGLVDGATKLAPLVTSVFGSLLQILLNIATAAMPFLVQQMNLLAGALKGFSDTTGTKKFSDLFAQLRPVFDSLVKLGGLLAQIVLQFLIDSAPYAKQLLDMFSGLAKQFLNWLKSKKGQRELQYFFETVIPLVRRLFIFGGRLVLFLVRFTEALGPLVGAAIDFANACLDILNTITLLAGAIFHFSGVVVGWLTNALGKVIGFATGLIDQFVLLGISILQGLVNGITGAAQSVWNSIKKFFEDIWASIVNWWEAGSPSQKMLRLGIDLILGLIQGVAQLAGTLANAFFSLFGIDFTGILTTFWNLGKSIVNWIINGISSVAGKVWNFITGLFTSHTFTDIFTEFWNVGRGIVNWIVNGVSSISGRIWAFITGIFTSHTFTDIFTKFWNLGRSIVNWIINGIASVAGTVWNTITGLFNGIDFSGIITQFWNLGREIVNGIVNGIKSMPGKVADAAKGMASDAWNAATGFLQSGSPSKLFFKVGTDVGKGFELGIKASASKVQKASRFMPSVAVPSGITPAGAGAGGGVIIENQTVQLPAAPGHDQMGDPRHQAAQFAAEMRRRGRS